MDVTAVVTYEDPDNDHPWWVAAVIPADGGGTTNARRLDQLVSAVAEMVVVRHDLDDDTEVNVTLDLSGVPGLAEALMATQEADVEAARALERARTARRNLAETTLHLTVRDLAVVLGVSKETAAKLRREVA